jgi:hypothetical protein
MLGKTIKIPTKLYLGFEFSQHQQVQNVQEDVIYNNASDIIEDDITNIA